MSIATSSTLRFRFSATNYLAILVRAARRIYGFFKLFPTRDKVVMISRNSTAPSLDFLMLKEEISRQSKTKVVILSHKMTSKLKHVFQILIEMWHLATARAVVVDSYVIPVSVLDHKPELKVVQIWHALGAIKQFGKKTIGKRAGNSEEMAKVMAMHKNYDYVVASSEETAKAYAECFGVSRESVKVVGVPRVDFLLDEKRAILSQAKMFLKYPQLMERKTILYAPTFRKHGKIRPEKLLEAVDLSRYNLIVKQHKLDKTEILERENVIVIKGEMDSAEILPVADYVITDYSAIAMEAALLKKPLYFWDYDIAKYRRDCGFMMDYEKEMPGLVTKDVRKILRAIQEDRFDAEKISDFAKKYVETQNGDCAKKIVEILGL